MGLSNWFKNLQELADARRELTDARRELAAAKEADGTGDGYASFGRHCQWLVAVKSASNADIVGSPLAVWPRLDGFAAEVSPMVSTANELLVRLKDADSATAFDVLAEFGLPIRKPPAPVRLARIVDAAEVLANKSQFLERVWCVSGAEDREMQAADVAEAAKRLLRATSGG